MRIVHISTSDVQGGAARSAFRLVEGLRLARQDCSMLVKHKTSTADFVHALAPGEYAQPGIPDEQAAFVSDYCIQRRRTPLSNTFFSLSLPACDISAHELVLRADIINLHWVAGFMSPATVRLLQNTCKPVVWTLHDQRPFTGGCHFSAGCRNFERDCKHCPQLLPDPLDLTDAVMADSLQDISSDIALAAPSRWIADCASQSALFRHARISVIPYGLDTTVFKPGREQARESLGLDFSAVYFLAGADYLVETRKGFDLLGGAIARCMSEPGFAKAVASSKVNFLFFGGSAPPAVNFPSRWLGRFTSDNELAGVYAACDALILPSREDNLPNTMLESMCCGTPVLGFNVGGLPDAITSGHTGLLAAAGDMDQLAEGIRSIAFDAELRHRLSSNCVQEIPSRFTLRIQADRYAALYIEELDRAKTGARKIARPPPAAGASPGFEEEFPKFLKFARRQRRLKRWNSLFRGFNRPAASHTPSLTSNV